MQITEEHRALARRQDKVKMSAATAARLKSINEQERATKDANNKFVEQFARLGKDVWTLHQLLQRCSSDQTQLGRRALKLQRCLANGWRVGNPADVLLFADLTADEARMTDDRFYGYITGDWPRRIAKQVQPVVRRSQNRMSVKATVRARLEQQLSQQKTGDFARV